MWRVREGFSRLKLDLLTSIDISTEKLLDTLMGYSREVGIFTTLGSWGKSNPRATSV